MSTNPSFLTKVWGALKAFGTDAEKVAEEVEKVQPILAPVEAAFNPALAAAADDFSSLAKIVTTGAQTVAAVTNGDPTGVSLTSIVPQVSSFLTTTEALAGKTIVDPAKFTSAATAITTAMQTLLSSVG